MGEYSENDRSNLGVINDPDVKVHLGPAFQKLSIIKNLGSELKSTDVLTLSQVKDLWKVLQESDTENKVYLHEILADSEVLVPELCIPKRNPELEKRISMLKNSLAEKEYKRMTQNVSSKSQFNPEDSIGYQMKEMNSGLIAVFQLVISLACAFLFGFMGIELFIGNLQLAVRLLLGIACALIVGAAELYFLAVNLAVAEDRFGSGKVMKRTQLNSHNSKPSKKID